MYIYYINPVKISEDTYPQGPIQNNGNNRLWGLTKDMQYRLKEMKRTNSHTDKVVENTEKPSNRMDQWRLGPLIDLYGLLAVTINNMIGRSEIC